MSKRIKKSRHKNEVFEKFGLVFFNITVDGKKCKAFTTEKTASRGYGKVAFYIDENGFIVSINKWEQIGHDIYEIFKD